MLRVAVDFGEITPMQKDVFRSVARIEPIVEPGEIWVTERAKVMLNDKYKAKLEVLGQKNINKGSEPEEFEYLFKYCY